MIAGNIIFWLATGYVWCGIVVAIAFLAFVLDRTHPSARGAYAFRPLLIPGLTLLWPLVVVKWLRRDGASKED